MAIKFGRPIEVRDHAVRDTPPSLDLNVRMRRNRKAPWIQQAHAGADVAGLLTHPLGGSA